MDDKNLITIPQLAKLLGVAVATIHYYRAHGLGPRAIKLGRLVRYRISDVEKWLEAQENQGK